MTVLFELAVCGLFMCGFVFLMILHALKAVALVFYFTLLFVFLLMFTIQIVKVLTRMDFSWDVACNMVPKLDGGLELSVGGWMKFTPSHSPSSPAPPRHSRGPEFQR